MEQLQQEINSLLDQLPNREEFQARLDELVSVYPFNEYEYMISTLLAMNILTLERYYELRDDYISRNLYLYIFEISAPRKFGESWAQGHLTWAQGHLKGLVPSLQKPSRRVDKNYSGQYDFYLDGIRIEVKASRAVDANSDEPLYVKALSSNSTKDFWMNFQQVKPSCCDVFVWIAVWRDIIRYWILSAYEVQTNPYYSKGQHRGNIGEGQLHVKHNNIQYFEKYAIKSNELEYAIRSAFRRQAKVNSVEQAT
ncbi:MAG: hypothetical protein OXC96_04335 [Cyanobacteria bacterium MAG CAR1_bin_15]|nr:hypothetical protein [Cyanobacteria bacterium MAG CAR1_bin_15]